MAICENEECGKEYWKAKDWQRFCQPKCRDDWHNQQRKLALVEMCGFRPTEEQRQAAVQVVSNIPHADVADAPHPWRNSFTRKAPLSEVMHALKERAETEVLPPQPVVRRV